MNWILQLSDNTSEYKMTSDEGDMISFKFSRSQQSIRMRYNEHYGVFVLDEGSLATSKIAIRNVYGSEIGTVTKGSWRETSGSVSFNDATTKISYSIISKDSSIEITPAHSKPVVVKMDSPFSEENSMLAIIVFSWMESVSANHPLQMI